MERRQPEIINGISIIIPAHQAQNFIETTLDSIENQTYFINNNNFEVLVGIDGCKKTLNKLLKIRSKYRNLRVFMMESNKGMYVTLNTLLDLVKYENVLRFDADDIMRPNLVKEISKINVDVVRIKYVDFNTNEEWSINELFSIYKKRFTASSIILFKKNILNKVGGYQSWTCVGDAEFMVRVFQSGFKVGETNDFLFYRRVHENSLTQKNETGIGSKVRNDYLSQLEIIGKMEDKYIEKETNKYLEIC